MNREILFRGKRKDNNKWVYGSLICDVFNKWYIHPNNCSFAISYYEVIPETIGQYTGFDDINNKKIFEQDIIEEGCNGLISSVVWDNEVGTYKLKGLGDYYIKDAPIEWKIIGNIYDNNFESEVK